MIPDPHFKTKNVLLISQSYPPRVAPSSRRSGCLAKYLPEFGWRPLVLTQRWTSENGVCDPDYVPGIPDQVLVKTVPVRANPPGSMGYFVDLFRRSFLPHTLPGNFLQKARPALENIFQRVPINVIWASYAPASAHVLADWASRRWGIPWVADFRDVVNQHFISIRSSAIVPIRLFFEKRVLKSASEIVTVSEGLAEILENRYRRPVQVISNGFDPVDLAPLVSVPVQKFNIVYTGTVLRGYPDFRPLLDGLQKCISSGEMEPDKVMVEFYGEGNEKRLRTLFRGHPCEYLVKIREALSWSRCRQVQREAAVLLQQTSPGLKGIYSSKIFDYLAARRPILAMPADGDCLEEILNITGAGFSCTSSDEIADRLLEWYREWKETGTIACRGRIDLINKYSRKEQAGQLAKILDELFEGK